jgi:hypothetical protein
MFVPRPDLTIVPSFAGVIRHAWTIAAFLKAGGRSCGDSRQRAPGSVLALISLDSSSFFFIKLSKFFPRRLERKGEQGASARQVRGNPHPGVSDAHDRLVARLLVGQPDMTLWPGILSGVVGVRDGAFPPTASEVDDGD